MPKFLNENRNWNSDLLERVVCSTDYATAIQANRHDMRGNTDNQSVVTLIARIRCVGVGEAQQGCICECPEITSIVYIVERAELLCHDWGFDV